MKKSSCKHKQNTVKKARYVAHLDIMGFSEVVKKNDDKAYMVLKAIKEFQSQVWESENKLYNGKPITIRPPNAVLLSDTILLYSSGSSYNSLCSILMHSANLFIHLFNHNIPIRGGIAHGDFIADEKNSLYVGKAFLDARDAGENAQWIGIVIEPNILKTQEKNISKLDGKFLVEWNIPLKRKCLSKRKKFQKGMVINWPVIYRDYCYFLTNPPQSPEELYCKLFKTFFDDPYDVLDQKTKHKYENTLAFIQAKLK